MSKREKPAPVQPRREFVKKAAYVTPAVLTMSIAPGIPEALAQDKGKGKGKGTPAPEPSTVGILGLGLAGVAAHQIAKKRRSTRKGSEESSDDE